MSRKRNQQFHSSGGSIARNCDAVEDDVRNQIETCRLSLRAYSEPVAQFPEAIQILQEQGRPDDLKVLGELVQGIAKDVDQFSGELKAKSEEFDRLKSQRPKARSEMSKHFNRCRTLGFEIIGINEKILNVTEPMVQQYSEVILKTKEAPGEGAVS